jgi:hypothetical protein
MRWHLNRVLDNLMATKFIFHLQETGGFAYTDKTSLQRTSSGKAWIFASGSKGL